MYRREVLKATAAGATLSSGALEGKPAIGATSAISGAAGEPRHDISLIPADSDDGFNYPYFLYAPSVDEAYERPILVEPNNTGRSTDDFDVHLEAAEALIERRAGQFGDELGVPVLVPVFPRPRSDPVDWRHYVHALDVETMAIDAGPLQRVDVQLLRMVEHAYALLTEQSYPVCEEILLNGFSASGNFVNRFTALHPAMVRAVTAGGINGTAILPIAESDEHTLDYQIGIADLHSLTGTAFDLERWQETDQLVYMGGDDENDTIPYSDAWNTAQRDIALDVYGQHMQEDRMPYCKATYHDAGATGRVEVYPNVGHRPVTDEIIEFHRKHVLPTFVTFVDPPAIGSSAVRVAARSRIEETFELRVFSSDRGELTKSAVELAPHENVNAQIPLSDPLTENEEVAVALVEPGVSNAAEAVDSETAVVRGRVQFGAQPTAGDAEVTLEYALSESYHERDAVTLRLDTEQGGANTLVDLQPGDSGTTTVALDDGEHGVPFEQTREVSAKIVDDDDPYGIDPVAVETAIVGSPSEPVVSVDVDAEPVVERGETASVEAVVRGLGGNEEDLDDLPIAFEVEGDIVATETVSLEIGQTDTARVPVPTDGFEQHELTVTAGRGDTTDQDTVVLADEPAAGDGTAESPYEVTTGAELAYASLSPASHFELVDDIDLADYTTFVPLGDANRPFTGVFDGRGHEIRNLRIDRASDGVGAFGAIEGGEITNLRIADAEIRGADFVGGIVGLGIEVGRIERVSVTGTIDGEDYVGGIVGGTQTVRRDSSDVAIEQVAVDASVTGANTVGGIIGQSSGDPIRRSYVVGSVTGSSGVGGIIGLEWFGGSIVESFAASTVSGSRNSGGLVGGYDELTVDDSYWDAEETGEFESAGGGVALTTDEMSGDTAVETLSGFDFAETWTTSDEYPMLSWERSIEIQTFSGPDVLELGEQATVAVTIANTDEEAVEETIEFRFAGAVVDTLAISLSPDETTVLEFEANTDGLDVGTYEYGVGTGSLDRTATVHLTSEDESVFEITELEFPQTVDEGMETSVTVTVTNLGREDEQEVVATIADDEDERVRTDVLAQPLLDHGAQVERTATLDTSALPLGAYVLRVETADDAREVEFVVERTTYVEFATYPTAGATSVTVNGRVSPAHEDSLRIRVGDENDQEITESPGTPRPGTEINERRLDLVRELEAGEQLLVVIQPSGGFSSPERIDTDTTTVEAADGSKDDSEEDNGTPSVADYAADDTGRVETDGLRDAVDDWRAGEIDTDLLRDVVDAWRSGEDVTAD